MNRLSFNMFDGNQKALPQSCEYPHCFRWLLQNQGQHGMIWYVNHRGKFEYMNIEHRISSSGSRMNELAFIFTRFSTTIALLTFYSRYTVVIKRFHLEFTSSYILSTMSHIRARQLAPETHRPSFTHVLLQANYVPHCVAAPVQRPPLSCRPNLRDKNDPLMASIVLLAQVMYWLMIFCKDDDGFSSQTSNNANSSYGAPSRSVSLCVIDV